MIEEKLCTLTFHYEDHGSRTVRIFIPEHEDGEKLPVIYMTDGQNLFDKKENQYGCWFTREAVREEKRISGRSAVIVGIHNDGRPEQRANELTPACFGEPQVPPGIPEDIKKLIHSEGELFDDFVINTIMPAIEAQFPVKTGRENTAFCGSSCGGLFTFYTVLAHPDIFLAGGVLSPVPVFMTFDEEAVKGWIKERLENKELLPYLYFYCGGGEPMEKDFLYGLEQLYPFIINEGYPEEKLFKNINPEAKHHESAWEPVFRDFLHKFLTDER